MATIYLSRGFFLMRKQAAFTLIELMITVSVAAIVLAVAIPSFNSQIQNNRSLAVGEDLSAALNFARSEAVKRGRAVTLCASNPARTACANDASAWSNGWLVVLEGNAATSTTTAASEILRVWEAPPNASIAVERGAPGTPTGFIRYSGEGAHARIGNSVQTTRMTAYTSGCKGDAMQRITVGVAGTINVSRDACA